MGPLIPDATRDPLRWVADMSGAHDDDSPIGSETRSWRATQLARGCRDLSLAPALLAFTASTPDARQKRHAYQLMLFIVANTQDAALAHQLAARIATEDSDEDSLYTLLIGLWESRVRLSAHLDQVLANIDDPREMVRCAAIRLVRSYDDAKRSDTGRFARFFHGMLARGVYLPPSQFEAAFVSAAHSDEDIEATLRAARDVLATL